MQKAKDRSSSPNPKKVSKAAAASKKKRTSIGNARARSQRSVKSAERRSTGPVEMGRSGTQNAAYARPRSQRIHPGKARRQSRTAS
jgi:hypothetical protein